MSEAINAWVDEVKEAVAQRAYTLNYEDGVQCRVLTPHSEEGRHTWQIALEMTHSGHAFDLTWSVRWTDSESDGIRFQLIAPETEGGILWDEIFVGVARFSAASDVLPVFIRGYFVGREAATVHVVAAKN